MRAPNVKYRRKGRERRLRCLFWFLKGKGGTRVGEASHPGPRNGGGYRRTQKQQAAAFGLSPQDTQGIADLVAKNLAQTYNLEARSNSNSSSLKLAIGSTGKTLPGH